MSEPVEPIELTHRTTIKQCKEHVFAEATCLENFPDFFLGAGPIPGVTRAWMKDKAEPGVGAIRMVELSDGRVVEEELLSWDPPTSYSYSIAQIKGPFSALVTSLSAEWKFAEPRSDLEETTVCFQYTMQSRSNLTRKPTQLLANQFMNKAMEKTLVCLKTKLELLLPPRWVLDAERPQCRACDEPFTVTKRRHHCRMCGDVFCGKCSDRATELPQFGPLVSRLERVCYKCWEIQNKP
eukprot:NODE_3641_length_868_cov_114.937922_g3619_i0.p1 GENE.NODE_3641_length_868_cov_114.937922_g3619_i0~~NODE_3641_length_868_cov_114.937922_g3619_i0.p1  ORF type:complete len:238 (+),score=28.73 NODE_3641_length_868_cov_114.937922_g3619_i0:57-770(+)